LEAPHHKAKQGKPISSKMKQSHCLVKYNTTTQMTPQGQTRETYYFQNETKAWISGPIWMANTNVKLARLITIDTFS
jgi:hypothetical protein